MNRPYSIAGLYEHIMFWGNMSMLILPYTSHVCVKQHWEKNTSVGLFANAGFERDTFFLNKTSEILYTSRRLRK